jgi:hypothetical protein
LAIDANFVGEITAIGQNSQQASQTHSPYVMDAQQIQDLTETINRLKMQQDEGVQDSTGAQANSHFGAHGQLHHVSQAAVAGSVREAAHIAEGKGDLAMARQLEYLAEMIEKGEVVFA